MKKVAAVFALGLAGFALVTKAASAQTAPVPTSPPEQTAPPNISRDQACAPTQALPQDGTIAPKGQTTGQTEPLGDKLAKSDGVICPPAGVDPEMHAQAPRDDSTMPVIPPPGSPGGDRSVVPK